MSASAGIYIHVPFCVQKCPYCDFYSGTYTIEKAVQYTDAVCRNLNALPEMLCADTVYFGGGTPSLLPAVHLERMLRTVRQRCNLSDGAEMTLEVNPLTATDSKLREWKRIGINRLSLGIQSFQPDVLRILGRKHTPEQGISAVLRACDAGFRNISIDLMLGLKEQSEDVWRKDLEQAADLPVTHISSYLLKIEPNTPFGSNPPETLNDDASADRWMQMHKELSEKGFSHYEISNFAKPGYESRHNCKYWRLHPYYGIGPAAHSCYGGVRYAVPPDLGAFCESSLQSAVITEPHADTESEYIMLGLRLAEGINLSALSASRETVLRNAKPMIPRLLCMKNDRLYMTPEGWLVSNSVLVRLLSGVL